jgi:hypothetical protein
MTMPRHTGAKVWQRKHATPQTSARFPTLTMTGVSADSHSAQAVKFAPRTPDSRRANADDTSVAMRLPLRLTRRARIISVPLHWGD